MKTIIYLLIGLTAWFFYSCNEEPEAIQPGNNHESEIEDPNSSGSDNPNSSGSDKKEEDSKVDEETNNENLSIALVGKWVKEDGKTYVFGENGTGYVEWPLETSGPWKGSILRYWIKKWYVENEELCFSYEGFSTIYKKSIKINNNKLYYQYNTEKEEVYSRINADKNYKDKYGTGPFDYYIEVMDRYFQLTHVTSYAKHGTGNSSNFKQIEITGPNIIYYISYYTPYYEGINADWSDGTYILNPKGVSPGSYWTYYGMLMINGSHKLADDENAKFTIKHSGNYVTYTLKSNEVNFYFYGK